MSNPNLLKDIYEKQERLNEKVVNIQREVAGLDSHNKLVEMRFQTVMETIERYAQEMHEFISAVKEEQALKKQELAEDRRLEQQQRAQEAIKRQDEKRQFGYKMLFAVVTTLGTMTLAYFKL